MRPAFHSADREDDDDYGDGDDGDGDYVDKGDINYQKT